jgi:hypothetical protein
MDDPTCNMMPARITLRGWVGQGRERIYRRALAAMGLGAIMAFQSAARADRDDDGATASQEAAVVMRRFVVSATRIDKNPWRYASVPGFEVLTRASEHDTQWRLDALRRGLWLEDSVMPKDWLPRPQVPYTVIVDDTDMGAAPPSQLHAPPTKMSSPVDALAWGELADHTEISVDSVESHDSDTAAINNNLFGVNTDVLIDSTMSLERLGRCAPPLPGWLIAGLLGREKGVFREAFGLPVDRNSDLGLLGQPRPVRKAAGPGTVWVSLKETQRILDHNDFPSIKMPPLRLLFAEAPPSAERLALWESQAALFVRWGLTGADKKDDSVTRAFFEFVRRARREPITEKVFADCFGFGFSAMEGKLADYLKGVLAQPTYVGWDMPSGLMEPLVLKEATSDQIGRILGDWLRMKGAFLRSSDPDTGEGTLNAAGRILERAYREDNGLPPDVDPSNGGAHSTGLPHDRILGTAVVMKPFVVSAQRIHDPGLLAVYGLYEHDIGNDVLARELLEAAVKSKVVRPRAYVALAELRYSEAADKPSGSGGKLSAEQAASVLEPLKAILRSAPTPDVYDMIVSTWTNCEARPAEGDIDDIVNGVALFPRDTDLAYNSALLCSQCGYVAQASELIEKGLVFTTHEMNKEYFEQLRASLGQPQER